MIDLTNEQLEVVRSILDKHVPQVTVLAYGSRVNGNSGKSSDLDLALVDKAPLPLSKISALKEDFSESDLPFRVDLIDFHQATDEFQQKIRERCYILYNKPRNPTDSNTI